MSIRATSGSAGVGSTGEVDEAPNAGRGLAAVASEGAARASHAVMVRPLLAAECAASARLHREVFHKEFLARGGPAFMRSYHRAWIDSPGALALGAVDGHGELVGVLLGSLDPAVHVAGMVRGHGLALGGRLLAAAAIRPRLARELIVTRTARYARGLWRTWRRPVEGPDGRGRSPDAPGSRRGSPSAAHLRSGEITHLLVTPSRQGQGIGRAMLAVATDEARRAGLDELVLVTPPEQAARGFYERLGWWPAGALTSRSGEAFVRYRYWLG